MNTLPRIPNLNALAGQLRFIRTSGRILLALIALLLITMPATQHCWSWDHFLHGGHDYELGTLMILSFISLAIVLAKHCKQHMDSLLAGWALLRFICRDSDSTGASQSPLCCCNLPCSAHAATGLYSFPLQI